MRLRAKKGCMVQPFLQKVLLVDLCSYSSLERMDLK